jgi:hypothetical protein
MDTNTLATGISLFSSAIYAIRQAIELLPDGSKKQAAAEALERAERELKIAEAQSADNLGYQICKNHFPPEIMLSSDETNWVCPKCGNKKKISYI